MSQIEAARTIGISRQLRDKYRDAFGEPTRSRNKDYLRKKVAWRIQELAEDGLSDRARARIDELAPDAPTRWRASRGSDSSAPGATVAEGQARDPCLPAPGTALTREYGGVEHQVTVLEDGFEYRGVRHGSLSKIAFEITGTRWNGLLFFRLKRRSRKAAGELGR